MVAKLVVVRGAKPNTIELKRLPTTIGRGREAKLKVTDTAVSRQHCELFEQDGRLMVRDLDSANGTYVNDDRISTPQQLATGDLLRIGPLTMKALCEETAPPAEDSFIDLDTAEGAEAVAESGSMSFVEYSETPDGSFIGIADEDEAEESAGEFQAPPDATEESSEAPADDVAESDEPANAFVGPPAEPAEAEQDSEAETVSKEGAEFLAGLEAEPEESVSADDDALDDFFKNI